jgi:hypothetical protein
LKAAISASSIKGAEYVSDAKVSSLDDLLLLCIDETLADLLGRRTRTAIYDYLERSYSLGRRDIPKHMDKFFGLMEETFGKGSRTIGKSVIKRMFCKLEWRFEDIPGFEFGDYVEAVRTRVARALVSQAKPSYFSSDSLPQLPK